ncbi:PBP1 and LysM peptidoglycan-binding domain-containing protein [Lutibacter flavus]|uniref:Amino acid/amide ABC transporter substrate-binding protein, HAAT family n=1 Tax=Lutibacter flavus TaxID=691689 RepID=A0A238ZIT6_9FLAO|nr:LysM peptidoglycan-binding domain-containing protein [Lutibacter flavus]SNR82623.1 amino acid/amide ABC transporter substrate-binding protein, HAAT family [Lutibacter flavus]
MKRIILLLAFLIGFTIVLEAQQKKYVSYTVKKGETLKSIARSYKISTRDLRKLNPDVSRKPKANTVIIVPNKNYGKSLTEVVTGNDKLYIVQPKETLYGISKKHNITIEDLKATNPELENGVKIGMKLIIPGSKNAEIEGEEKFMLHTVIKDDTVYNLTKKYDISREDLFSLNPNLSEGLKLGMVLKIKPVEEGELVEDFEEETETSLFVESLNFDKTVNVAIMLPYQLNKYSDSIPDRTFEKGNSILNIATDFHQGASMAIDSLRRKGIHVNVSYFDTQNSSYKLQTIVDRNDFSETDVVIGPLFYSKAHWLSNQIDAPVIAPLYSKDQDNLSDKNLIKSDSNSDITLEETLLVYLKENYNGENIIIINDGNEGSQSKLWKAVNEIKTFDSIQNISVIKSQKGFIDNEKIAEKLKEDSTNWIILISDDNVTTAAAVNNLKVFIEEYKLTLFSINKGRNFDHIDNSFLGQLNFVYPTTDFVNMENKNVKRFFKKFRVENYSAPSKYAIRGFDVTYDALIRLASKNDLEEGLKAGKSERVSAYFNYNKKMFGSFENNGVYLVQYNKELIPVILE